MPVRRTTRAVWSHSRPPPARADTLLATVDLRQHELGLTLAFERCFPAYVGLRIRREEARRCLNQAFADCSQDWDETGFALMIPITQVAAARSVFPRLAEALAEIVSRPLTPCLLKTHWKHGRDDGPRRSRASLRCALQITEEYKDVFISPLTPRCTRRHKAACRGSPCHVRRGAKREAGETPAGQTH